MIHPRRLSGKPANVARYYMVGDYYTKGAGEQSEWGGALAPELGLEGAVDPAIFRELLSGKVGEQQLGRRRADGEIQHHPGWDFAINAPKSVSIMALVAGDERIQAAHEKAVGAALGYLEEHAELRRRVDGDIVHETTGRLLFARFTEHASRELDPHLHTHVVVMNMTRATPDAPMASLETRAMFVEQMTAGQVYRNELAHALRGHGYVIETDPRRGLFEIRGVPADLVRSMSQRAEQIDRHAEEHGLTGQAARRQSFYETRRRKDRIDLETLRQQWTSRAAAHEPVLSLLHDRADRNPAEPLATDPIASARAGLFGIRQSEGREAVNNMGQLLRTGLAFDVGAVRLSDIRPLIDDHERRRKLLATRIQTGDQLQIRGRTTRRTARMETALSEHLSLGVGDSRPIASPDAAANAAREAALNPAQTEALIHVATSTDRITGVHGVAGAGKSTLIRALVAAMGPDRHFIAVAPTSSAAINLGKVADIEDRTVASLIAGGGRSLGDSHVLVIDEAGQLGNRQALRLLELSRISGARIVLLGDNKQTGAIEQGKAFWLLQRLGLPTSHLPESVRQETRSMKAAVASARSGDYAASLAALDRVIAGDTAERLARNLVAEWTRLRPDSRAATNILVLDNATRLIVNTQIRETLGREGTIAAEESRLHILASAGLTAQEKHYARFYSGGQVVTFARDIGAAGIARDIEYRVVGLGRGADGRQLVRLVDQHGREVRWDPRTANAAQINVFAEERRDLAVGDRIQWRLVNKDLGLRNAERGTVEGLQGSTATIRWDRDQSVQEIDLHTHRTWDHGYAETVYSAQSKTYDRVYVLAPVASPLVNGQNYYTAVTRARFGVKLWTEDVGRLADKLDRFSGEKSSALEGLGRIARDGHEARSERHSARLDDARIEMLRARDQRQTRMAAMAEQSAKRQHSPDALTRVVDRAQSLAESLHALLSRIAGEGRNQQKMEPPRAVRDRPVPGKER